jgi:hypothetical protein
MRRCSEAGKESERKKRNMITAGEGKLPPLLL